MITLQFREGENTTKFETTLKGEMQKQLDHFDRELKKIRTGRASTTLVEDIPVECYGNKMKLRDVATITTADAQTIVIQPWDQGNIPAIESAIDDAHLGLTAQNDGAVIKLRVPPMTAEQRENLVKNVHKKLEECKVAVRNVRKDFNNWIRDLEKNKAISEDTSKRLQNILQKITDQSTETADAYSSKKEKEIRTI
jgi:ribosome recycling factor